MLQKRTLPKPEEIKRVIQLPDGRQLPLSRPLVMGILNITPDSFSDGGRYDSTGPAVAHALAMIGQGADIIDIGGESSRPGAEPVTPEEEIRRVIPVIARLRAQTDIPLSIDTYRSETARAALDAGADIVNDISAFRQDPAMAELAAERRVPAILMHMQGTPRDMQMNPTYTDCVAEIVAFFRERISFARDRGVLKEKLILDPGIGFGKRLADNLALLAHLDGFGEFNLPLLVGVSRKSFIGMLDPAASDPGERIGGSLAAAVAAVLNGADIVRVHDVAETVQALKVIQAIGTSR